MILILLIFSFSSLILFFILKFKNKALYSHKSDIFLKNIFRWLEKIYFIFMKSIYNFPLFLKIFFGKTKDYLNNFYKVVAKKIQKKIGIKNNLNLNKKRGVASVFLRVVSEEKIKNKK